MMKNIIKKEYQRQFDNLNANNYGDLYNDGDHTHNETDPNHK